MRGLGDDVLGHNGGLAAAARGVHHEGGHAEAGGVAAQSLDDLDALADGGAEVLQAHGQVALIDVVGTHADADQLVDQLLHGVDAVIDAGQQHALVAQRDTGVGQHGAGLGGLGGDLVGVVEVGVQPDGVILLQHVAQLGGDALRQHHGSAGADADDLHVGDLTQLGDDVLQALVAHQQGVAAGQQHVADLGSVADVLDGLIHLIHGQAGVVLAGEAAAGAVTAVHGALVSDQQQAAVGIAVGQTGSGGVLILVQGIQQVGVGLVQLLGGGDGLQTDGIMGITGLDQGQVVGGDGHAQGAQAGLDAFLFLGSQLDVLLQIFQSLDTVLDLPVPVIPLLIGHVGEQDLTAGLYHNKVILSKSDLGRH